jgi:hypothetical protein
MLTGVLGAPTSTLVDGLVLWYRKVAGTIVMGAMEQLVAVVAPALTMVANAVAVPPTTTDRLPGSTAETND